jgi:hypothetical protein
VGHGAGVLGELHGAQHAHVADALDRARAGGAGHVHAELLVAEDRQAFLQRELEPVAAGDAVAGPVVEVLVADHALDGLEVGVGGGGGLASTYLVLKMFRPLFSIAPMLKSLVATIMKRSRSS